MLPNYAKWYGFTPPHWPNFPPPLTNCGWGSRLGPSLLRRARVYRTANFRGSL